MSFDAHSNFGLSTVASAPSPPSTATSLVVADASTFPAVPFNCTCWPPGVNPTFDNAEIIRVTAILGTIFTIARAQEGTTAQSIADGWNIANTTTVKVFTDIESAIASGAATWGNIFGTLTNQADLVAALATAASTAVWGSISGTLSNQADLQAALNAKLSGVAWGIITGTLSNQADLQAALNAKISGVAWGVITGTLSDQADLQAALNAKISGVAWGDITGTLSNQTDLQSALDAKQNILTQAALTYAGTTDIDMTGADYQTLTLAGNVTFTTSNKAAARSKTVIITCDGTPRTFVFPSWVWVGVGAPSGIAASKKGVLSLTCLGAADTDIIAVYSVQNP